MSNLEDNLLALKEQHAIEQAITEQQLEKLEERIDALEKEIQDLKERVEKIKRNKTIEQLIKGLELLGYDITLTSRGESNNA